MNKIAVFTAITGGYDSIPAFSPLWAKAADFIAFTDSPASAPGWTIRTLKRQFADPCRNAKLPKVLSHVYLPTYEFTIWIDGCVEIVSEVPVETFIRTCLRDTDLAVFPHRFRNCIYQEAVACIIAKKDSQAVIIRQVDLYRAGGYPAHNGLAECTVIIRRHTEAISHFNVRWHKEICAHSRRDQLSFNYVSNSTNLRFAWLPGSIAKNEHFRWGRHLIPKR